MVTLLYDASTKSDDKSGRAQPTDMLYTLSGPTTWSLVEGGTVNATRKTFGLKTMSGIKYEIKTLKTPVGARSRQCRYETGGEDHSGDASRCCGHVGSCPSPIVTSSCN